MSGFSILPAIRNQPIKKEFQGTPIEKGAEMMSNPKDPASLFFNIMARDVGNSGSMTVTKTGQSQQQSMSPMSGYQSASGRRASFVSRRRARLLGTGTNLES